MNRNNIYLGIIILALLLSNIYSYQFNKSLTNEFNNYEETINNKYLYPYRHRLEEKLVNDKGYNKNSFRLVVLFSNYGCNAAIKSVLDNVNIRNNHLKKFIDYYYLESEHENNYAYKYLSRRIDIDIIQMNKDIFNGNITVDNPVILLVDINGYVYDIHKSVDGNQNATNAFFNRINYLFESN